VTHTSTGPAGFQAGVAVNPVTDMVHAVVDSFPPDTVLVINPHANAITSTIALSAPPEDIAADPPPARSISRTIPGSKANPSAPVSAR
jgi:hypothetical protein